VGTICTNYLWRFGGAQRGSIPVGVTTGMLNQLGSSLVLKFVPLLNFSSTSKSKSISVFLIFSLYYFNMVLLPLVFSVDYRNNDQYNHLFNENNWYTIFARSIYISFVLTSFLPYVFGPFLGWMYIKCYKK